MADTARRLFFMAGLFPELILQALQIIVAKGLIGNATANDVVACSVECG